MNGMKIAIDINPIDLENWSYGWSLSVQRYGPDPRFFQKTWDLIVSRVPKPLNVLMTLKSSRFRDGQGLAAAKFGGDDFYVFYAH
jgi:hypothetical protein